jgi:hypothetical protein
MPFVPTLAARKLASGVIANGGSMSAFRNDGKVIDRPIVGGSGHKLVA